MLDIFLRAAMAKTKAEEDHAKLASSMKQLPKAELFALATGQIKLGGEHGICWLDRFKGTPLMSQAIELEQREIQMDAADQQRRSLNSQNFAERDQLRLQKRMLELQLAEQESGAGPEAQAVPLGQTTAPPPEAQGAGAAPVTPTGDAGAQKLSSVKSNITDVADRFRHALVGKNLKEKAVDAAKEVGGKVKDFAKGTADVVKEHPAESAAIAGTGLVADRALSKAYSKKHEGEKKASAELFQIVDGWGRELARADFEKRAHQEYLLKVGGAAGTSVANMEIEKTALGFMESAGKSILGAGKSLSKGVAKDGLGAKILQQVRANPSLALAGGGAVLGGVAGGLKKDEHGHYGGIGGALQGAAMGGLVGGGLGMAGGHAVDAYKAQRKTKLLGGLAAGAGGLAAGAAALPHALDYVAGAAPVVGEKVRKAVASAKDLAGQVAPKAQVALDSVRNAAAEAKGAVTDAAKGIPSLKQLTKTPAPVAAPGTTIGSAAKDWNNGVVDMNALAAHAQGKLPMRAPVKSQSIMPENYKPIDFAPENRVVFRAGDVGKFRSNGPRASIDMSATPNPALAPVSLAA